MYIKKYSLRFLHIFFQLNRGLVYNAHSSDRNNVKSHYVLYMKMESEALTEVQCFIIFADVPLGKN